MKAFTLAISLMASPAFAQPTIESVIEKMSEHCAGNGSGSYVTKYSVAKLDVAKEMSKLKGNSADMCANQREQSRSKAEGVSMTLDYLKQDSCLKEHLSAQDRALLYRTVAQKDNEAVLASIYSGGDNPEGCSFWDFLIFTADGKKIQIEFNETD